MKKRRLLVFVMALLMLSSSVIMMTTEVSAGYDIIFCKRGWELGDTPLAGAKLQIESSAPDPGTAKVWTTDNNDVSFNLDPGEYKLVETAAPTGYAISDPIDFRVLGDGTVEVRSGEGWVKPTDGKVTMVNYPDPNILYPLTIRKEAGDTGNQLPGATLSIDAAGAWDEVERWTTTDTPHETKLPAGDYRLCDIEAPDGYATVPMIFFRVHVGGEITVEGVPVVDKTIVMVDPVGYLVSFSKTDEDGNELPGAWVILQKSGGTFQWGSGKSPRSYYLEALPAGEKYTYYEDKAPKGYLKSDEKIDFRVLDGGSMEVFHGGEWKPWDSSKPLVLVNKRDPNAEHDVTVSKVTEYEPNKQLLNVNLRIDKKDGAAWTELENWTTTDTPHVVKLKMGDYRLVEVAAPADYAQHADIEFTVHFGGKVTVGGTEVENATVVMVNKFRTDTEWDVKFRKYDWDTHEEIVGTDLKIESFDGTPVASWTTDATPKVLSLHPGVYKLIETKAADGYQLREAMDFAVLPNGDVQRKSEGNWHSVNGWWPFEAGTVAMYNYRMMYDLDIIKIDSNTNKGLAGAEMKLETTFGTGSISWTWTSSEGVSSGTHYWGEYKLTELAAPAGYKLAEEIEFRIDAYGNVGVKDENGVWQPNTGSPFNDPMLIVMKNDPIPYDVTFSKIASNRSGELKGAELRVEKSDGTLLEKWTSTDTAKVIPLIAGEYKMVETKAPKGYWAAKDIVFRVNADGSVETWDGAKWVAAKDAAIKMTDCPKDVPVGAPKTGDTSNLMLYAGICLLAAAGLASLMFWKHLKKERAKSVESEESAENKESAENIEIAENVENE